MFNIADNRIYMNDENGKMIAEVTFPNLDDNTIVIDHTFVDDSRLPSKYYESSDVLNF